jgi:hypothetical protein
MRSLFGGGLGIFQAALGLVMIVAPRAFYDAVPGVPETGPFNPHFVRDIGCAFLVTGAGLVWGAADRRGRAAAVAAAAFLWLHAMVHVWDGLAGRERPEHLLHDLPLMLGFAALATWAAWPTRFDSNRGGTDMLKWFFRRQLNALDREFGYDSSYARELLDIDTGAFLKFARVMGLARYRKDVPAEVYSAAGLVGVMAEDCGPCTQLGVTMAEREGVPATVLRAILEGDEAAMPADVALAYRFARATLAHDPEADELREEVVRRWGERGLVSLAFGITASRLFPTVKYALGHGKACVRVKVGGKTIDVARPQVAG